MKRIRRALKLLAFVCLIALAGVGIGLSGGVPIPLTKSRRDSEKENTEQIDSRKGRDGINNEVKE